MSSPHDFRLLDALGNLQREVYNGAMWRVVREGRSPQDGSRGAGRWNPASLEVLYGAQEPDGALAEVHFHLSRGQSIFPSKIRHSLYELQVETKETLVFANLDALVPFGVDTADYKSMLYKPTQEIAAAASFIGFDGLIAPSARWSCQNIILFLDQVSPDDIQEINHQPVDWTDWRQKHANIKP